MESKSIYEVDTIAIGWIINTGKAASEMLAIYAAHSISALLHSIVCTVRELSNALPISRIRLAYVVSISSTLDVKMNPIQIDNNLHTTVPVSYVQLTETRGVVL